MCSYKSSAQGCNKLTVRMQHTSSAALVLQQPTLALAKCTVLLGSVKVEQDVQLCVQVACCTRRLGKGCWLCSLPGCRLEPGTLQCSSAALGWLSKLSICCMSWTDSKRAEGSSLVKPLFKPGDLLRPG